MTYKTYTILTRLKTAPHVSVARRMEPFAKHLLNLASWLEQPSPSQHSGWALLMQSGAAEACPCSPSPALALQLCSVSPALPTASTLPTAEITAAPEPAILESNTLLCQQPGYSKKLLRMVREVTESKFAYLCTVSAIKHFPLDFL